MKPRYVRNLACNFGAGSKSCRNQQRLASAQTPNRGPANLHQGIAFCSRRIFHTHPVLEGMRSADFHDQGSISPIRQGDTHCLPFVNAGRNHPAGCAGTPPLKGGEKCLWTEGRSRATQQRRAARVRHDQQQAPLPRARLSGFQSPESQCRASRRHPAAARARCSSRIFP